MSGNSIPFDIQSEIIKRLPVKSLLRFRSVSKSYKSLIHSSHFIANYTSQHQHLLIKYKDEDAVNNYIDRYNYVSVVDDDDTFPTQKVWFTLPELDQYPDIIGSSHGLLCFYSREGPTHGTARVLIFNPCIRKTLTFPVPRVADGDTRETVLDFGVCRETMDPKIVKVTFSVNESVCIPWEVEVFTLSTRAWRSPYSTNFPSRYIYIYRNPVVVDGCLYWLASDRPYWWYHLIISFDMTSEEFKEVNLPDNLAHGTFDFTLYKLGESLALVKEGLEDHKVVYDVWMMVDDDPKWFKMLYTISSHSPSVSILWLGGFRKTGEPLIEVILQVQHGSTRMLAAYDPYSKSITNVGIDYGRLSSYVYSYTEILLLL